MSSPDDETRSESLFDGRYRIRHRLGSGGMARVLLAEDVDLHRQVALKVLADRYTEDAEFVERFAREARAAAGLNHPNIVAIYDRGKADGAYYIAMEFLDGETLKELIQREGPLASRKAIDITLQLLAALRFAHRRDIVHRDVKPQNIMVLRDGRVKVTDFGIARAGASDITEAGSIVGTAQYLSPEQARGQHVGPESDLYSVGVVLYEMLTGHVPFSGDSSVAVAMKHVAEPPVPPRKLDPSIPPDLERIVLRAMAKDPARRYRSADEMGLDLDRVRKGLPLAAAAAPIADGRDPSRTVIAPPPARTPQHPSPPRRTWPWIVVLLLAAIAAAFAAYVLLGNNNKHATTTSTQTTSTAQQTPLPKVVGLPQAQALAKLQGFKVTTTNATSDIAAAGTVILQNPSPLTQVLPGSKVTLTVSSGPAPKPIPDVTNQPFSTAQGTLQNQKFVVVQAQKSSPSVPSGTVISQNPAANTLAKPGATVTLTVSTGPALGNVPDVSGFTVQDARTSLKNAGFKTRQGSVTSSDTVAKGHVIRQSPAGGTQAPTLSFVTIDISSGPNLATIPSDLVGKNQHDARSELLGMGFQVAIQSMPVTDTTQIGLVQDVSPAQGTAVPPGSTVTLIVGVHA